MWQTRRRRFMRNTKAVTTATELPGVGDEDVELGDWCSTRAERIACLGRDHPHFFGDKHPAMGCMSMDVPQAKSAFC